MLSDLFTLTDDYSSDVMFRGNQGMTAAGEINAMDLPVGGEIAGKGTTAASTLPQDAELLDDSSLPAKTSLDKDAEGMMELLQSNIYNMQSEATSFQEVEQKILEAIEQQQNKEVLPVEGEKEGGDNGKEDGELDGNEAVGVFDTGGDIGQSTVVDYAGMWDQDTGTGSAGGVGDTVDSTVKVKSTSKSSRGGNDSQIDDGALSSVGSLSVLDALKSQGSISSVYDHSYLEGDTSKPTVKSHVSLREQSSKYEHHQSPQPGHHSSPPPPPTTSVISSSGSSVGVGNEEGATAFSSASILKNLRLQQQLQPPAMEESLPYGTDIQTYRTGGGQIGVTDNNELFSSNGSDTVTSSSTRNPKKDNILQRLERLFRAETNSSSSSSVPAHAQLTTPFILSHFNDLGDQYAPLFKELLKRIAVCKRGKWSLRNQPN